MHEAVRHDGEVLPAGPTAIGLRLPRGSFPDVVRLELGSPRRLATRLREPPFRRLVIGEHAEQVLDRESL